MSNTYTKYIFESTDEILKEIKTLKEKVNNDFKKDSDLKDINDIANELYKIAIKISDSGTLTDLEDDQGQEMELDGPAFMSEFSYYQDNDILDFMESLDEEDFAEWKEDEVDEDGDYDENSAIDFIENHGVSVARLDYNEYFGKKYTLIVYAR